jgi:phosphoesterase RecJ-like protein
MPNFINLKKCREIFFYAKNIVISTHTNPDGDAIGSELALYHYAKQYNKNIEIINDTPTPANLIYLKGSEVIKIFDEGDYRQKFLNADLIIVVDLNDSKRLKSVQESVLKSRAKKLVIDHHLEPQNFADYYLIDSTASSTGEIIWRLINEDMNSMINPETANAIYCAIMTDTGVFRFSNTNAVVHSIISRLIDFGADIVDSYNCIYNQNSLQSIHLLGEALQSISLYFNNQVSIMTITKDMFLRTKALNEDIDNYVEKTLSIRGVKFGVLIAHILDNDEIRLSFRSKDDFISAREVAVNFGGGGHEQAAGARIFDNDIHAAKSEVLNVIGKLIKKMSDIKDVQHF